MTQFLHQIDVKEGKKERYKETYRLKETRDIYSPIAVYEPLGSRSKQIVKKYI